MKGEDGRTRKLVDTWGHSVYAAAGKRADLIAIERSPDYVSRFVSKFERATDIEESEVLELVVR
ncbi:MAG: hypothetical protein ACRD6W_05290, partial [Nitrososphaerales archaeon]